MKYFHYAFICNGKAPCAGSLGCWYKWHNSDGTENRDIPFFLQDQLCDHTTDIHYAKNIHSDFELLNTGNEEDLFYIER